MCINLYTYVEDSAEEGMRLVAAVHMKLAAMVVRITLAAVVVVVAVRNMKQAVKGPCKLVLHI